MAEVKAPKVEGLDTDDRDRVGLSKMLNALINADYAMYIFINKGIDMSTGKVAAMAAHAATESVWGSPTQTVVDWRKGGHYKKLVMQARDTEHLNNIQKYVEDRGFKTFPIIDEGLTEIPRHSFVALGVEIVNKADEHTKATFECFELYRSKIKVNLEIDR